MNTAEIVVSEVQRDSSFQVRQLLAERIGEPRKPAKLHPHREVLPFHVASRNVALAGVSDSHLGYNLDDWAWGVPLSSMLPIVPVQLHKLGKVHVQSEGFLDGIPVKVETIRGQLDLVGQTIMQIADKLPRVFHRPLADDVGCDQFGVCVHRNENPLISDLVQIVAIAYLALLLGHKRPDFIALYVAAIQVAQLLIQQLLASLANGFEQAHDGVSIQAREPFRTANRAPLDKTLNRTRCRVRVRGHRIPRQIRVGFAESGSAGSAAPALDAALTEIPKSLADLVLASFAGHLISPLALGGETSQNTYGSEAWVTPRFGLAPPPVSAGSGALIKNYSLGWWFDRDIYGVTGSDSDRDSDHAGFILSKSPVDAGLSYFTPKSSNWLYRRRRRCWNLSKDGLSISISDAMNVLALDSLHNRMNRGHDISVLSQVISHTLQLASYLKRAEVPRGVLLEYPSYRLCKAKLVLRDVLLAKCFRESGSGLLKTDNLIFQFIGLRQNSSKLLASQRDFCLNLLEHCPVIKLHGEEFIQCINISQGKNVAI